MKLFALRRAYGAAQIIDGLVHVFTPWRTGIPLVVAKALAREREKHV